MKLNRICIAFVVTSLFAETLMAEEFQCGFIQDKYPSGKSNKATCSMLPEEVFSNKYYTPKKNEHCQVDPVYLYEDLEDVIINTKKMTVTWNKHSGLTEDAKPKQKKYFLENGIEEKEAEKRVNAERREQESFRIIAHQTTSQNISFDEITRKLIDPPKQIPQHTFIMTDAYSNLYYIYLPESSGHAILMKPDGMADSTWVEMRFGKCRRLK